MHGTRVYLPHHEGKHKDQLRSVPDDQRDSRGRHHSHPTSDDCANHIVSNHAYQCGLHRLSSILHVMESALRVSQHYHFLPVTMLVRTLVVGKSSGKNKWKKQKKPRSSRGEKGLSGIFTTQPALASSA